MRTRSGILFLLTIISLVGCRSHVKVEPFVFSHEDELIRTDEFIALADRRVFAVMAFMNLCGFDDESVGKEMHPARVHAREAMQAKAKEHPKALKRWKRYYQRFHIPSFTYLNYALTLNDDYPFRRIRPNRELWNPKTGAVLAKFPAILNQFWETLEMEQIWDQVKPHYLAEIQQYHADRSSHKLTFTWDYLRLKRGDQFTFVSIPNLMDRRAHSIGSLHENYWCTVESPGSISHDLNIHEYLHSIINPMVKAHYADDQAKLNQYFEAGKNMPMAESYGHPVTYAYECLVRALDHRIYILLDNNPSTTQRRETKMENLTQNGLLLVQPFYQLLTEYEKSDLNFEEFVPMMLERIPEYSD